MTHKKTLNIFLEYIAGGSLNSLLRKYGNLNENIVRIYTTQILQGLEYLHWNGVVHRGFKKIIKKSLNFSCKKNKFQILKEQMY